MEKYTIFNFGLLHLEWTNALFVLIVFSICAFFMNALLFKPVIRTLNNRIQWKGAGSDKIEHLQKNIDNANLKIINIQKNSLQKMSSYREQQIKEVKKIADDILQKTRQKLDIENKAFYQELQKEIAGLESNIDEISDKLLAQLKQKI